MEEKMNSHEEKIAALEKLVNEQKETIESLKEKQVELESALQDSKVAFEKSLEENKVLEDRVTTLQVNMSDLKDSQVERTGVAVRIEQF